MAANHDRRSNDLGGTRQHEFESGRSTGESGERFAEAIEADRIRLEIGSGNVARHGREGSQEWQSWVAAF